MKSLSPAHGAPARALGWIELLALGAGWALALACESKGASDAPRPATSVKTHPAFSVPKTPEMQPDPEPSALRVDAKPPPPKPREKKDWQANCKIQKGCAAAPQELPICGAEVPQRPWVDVVSEGDVLVGKEVAVSGTLGLSLIKKTGSGPCPSGACCHTLEMQIVLVGEPTGSLPLRGLICSGDDSLLCCNVPVDGQAVVARGRLQKLASGVSKWQLNDPSLCLIDNTPRH